MTSRVRVTVGEIRSAREAGMVTAETAAVLPAFVLVLALALTSVRIGIDQVRCIDAARAGARAAARGDTEADVRAVAERAAPRGSTVTVSRDGGDVVTTVTAPTPLDLPVIGDLPAPVARAISPVEGAGAGWGRT